MSSVGVISLSGLRLRVIPPANPPIAAPDSRPSTAASSTPSSIGLPSAMFCSTVSEIDCGNSSSTPSEAAPSRTRLTTFFWLAASAPSVAARPLALRVPPAIIVSTSPMPSFWATLPPAKPKPAVVAPVAAASPACLPVNKPSSVCWRICSAARPAPTAPSPNAPAATGDSFGATAPRPRPTTPPASIGANDSTTVLVIKLGLSIACPNLAPKPWAFWKSRSCSWVRSVLAPAIASFACAGRKPNEPPSFSKNLPTRPPVGISAIPTANSGTETALDKAAKPKSRTCPPIPLLGAALFSLTKRAISWLRCFAASIAGSFLSSL